MTAHLVLQRLSLNRVITIDNGVNACRSSKKVSVPANELQSGKPRRLLLFSGNDDAYALSIAAGGSRANFVRMMNQEAKRLGLRHTHFRSPSGVIDKDNYSSAADLAMITRVAMRDPGSGTSSSSGWRVSPGTRRPFRRSTSTRTASSVATEARTASRPAGRTKAGHCLVASATRDGRTLIAVVLGSSRPYNDAARLLNLGFGLTS